MIGIAADVRIHSFSSCFSKPDSPTGGVLTLGGVDPARYSGDFTCTPVIKKAFWQIEMEGVRVDEEPYSRFCVDGCPAIVDTGTTLIGGPPAEIESLNIKLGAQQIPDVSRKEREEGG